MDTALNEFVYTVLFKADYEQKRKLKGKFLKAAMTEKSARFFSENSSKEEKEILLATLGYEFCYIINPARNFKLVQDLLTIIHTAKKSQINAAITQHGIFITTDKQLLRTLGLMAQTTHTPSYYMDLEILRQGYHIAKWKKRYGGEKDNTYRNIDETARTLSLLLCNAMSTLDVAKGLVGATRTQVKILLYLYASPMDVSDQTLKDYFIGRLTGKEFGDSIRSLMHEGRIERLSNIVSITGSGIKIVNDYLHSVIHSNNF